MCNKRIVIVSLVFLLSFFSLSAAFAEKGSNQLHPDLAAKNIERAQSRINDMVKQGNFEEALKLSENLETFVKAQRPEVVEKYLTSVQKNQVEIQEKQGNYEAAAAKAEKAAKENKAQDIQKKAESAKQSLASQKESFQKQMNLASKIHDKDMEIYKLVKARDQALKELSGKKPEEISKAKLADLQSLMKKTSAEIAAKEKERTGLYREWQAVQDKHPEALSPEMEKQLVEKVQNLEKIQDNLKIAQQDINFRYEDLTSKAKVGWTGFADKLAETHKMQKDMLDLQKKMQDLAGKGKLSGDDLKAFTALKNQYSRLKDEVDEKMGELQKTFEDSKTFDDLNAEQAGRLKGLFQDIRKNRDFLAANEKKLDSATKKVEYGYGDVNGDGVVDQNDLAIMQKLTSPGLKRELESGTLKGKKIDMHAADVDGDGRVTQNDLKMIQSKVWGFRKTFPVDPKNIPGDMNGNGKIDKEDAARFADCLKDPNSTLSSFRDVADMNGDGKVNESDKAIFLKAQKAQEGKSAEESKKANDELNSAPDSGDSEKDPKEKRQAPSTGNPFSKGRKSN